MNDTLKQISGQISSLTDASIERSGRFFYICKDGKLTNLKAPVNEETEKLDTAADLMAYIFRGLQGSRVS